jgi:hypothetical protein
MRGGLDVQNAINGELTPGEKAGGLDKLKHNNIFP